MSGDATEGEEEDVMAAQRKNEWALNVFFHSRRLERCGSRIFGSLKRREEERRCKDSRQGREVERTRHPPPP